MSEELVKRIREGYAIDEYCQKLKGNLGSMDGLGVREQDGLLYMGS